MFEGETNRGLMAPGLIRSAFRRYRSYRREEDRERGLLRSYLLYRVDRATRQLLLTPMNDPAELVNYASALYADCLRVVLLAMGVQARPDTVKVEGQLRPRYMSIEPHLCSRLGMSEAGRLGRNLVLGAGSSESAPCLCLTARMPLSSYRALQTKPYLVGMVMGGLDRGIPLNLDFRIDIQVAPDDCCFRMGGVEGEAAEALLGVTTALGAS